MSKSCEQICPGCPVMRRKNNRQALAESRLKHTYSYFEGLIVGDEKNKAVALSVAELTVNAAFEARDQKVLDRLDRRGLLAEHQDIADETQQSLERTRQEIEFLEQGLVDASRDVEELAKGCEAGGPTVRQIGGVSIVSCASQAIGLHLPDIHIR